MDFRLNNTQKLFLQMVKDFAENEVKDFAEEIDKQERYPEEIVKKMGEVGLLGITIPRKYCGANGDEIMYALAGEELSKACATVGTILGAHTSLGTVPILNFGNDLQKDKYLKNLATGKSIGAFALTEPNAGTDAAAQQTTAVLDGDSYILNGNKIFITNAGYADIYIVMAMTDKSAGVRGISGFIVEANTIGFSIGKKEKKLGIRGSATSELVFEDCRIPKENLLAKEGFGFKIAMHALDGGRVGVAAQAVGIAQGALDECIKYVKERKQFNKPLAFFQNTQFQIAEMATKIEAARLLVLKAAFKKQNKIPFSKDAAMAKYYCSNVASEVCNKALQLFGGYGYMREYPIERMLRDAKITEIYEGTSEVQKMVIAAHLLGK